MDRKYYIVTAKCGHVGKNNYIIIDFAIHATSKKDAARITRQLPRVKHNHKDAIIHVEEVDYETYQKQKDLLDSLFYLKSSNIQDQRLYYSNYYDDRIAEEKVEHKTRGVSIPFRLLRQLVVYRDYDPKEYNQIKNEYIWQNKRIMQN